MSFSSTASLDKPTSWASVIKAYVGPYLGLSVAVLYGMNSNLQLCLII